MMLQYSVLQSVPEKLFWFVQLTGSFKKDVCFVMFVDGSTLDVMQREGQQLDERGFLGPWRVVMVKNLPYTDARRVGKIPKFLTHRLFPAARWVLKLLGILLPFSCKFVAGVAVWIVILYAMGQSMSFKTQKTCRCKAFLFVFEPF